MSRKKNSVNKFVDSFINSVNQTGEGFGAITSVIFVAGGLFASYTGYTGASIILLAGGLITTFIGLMIGYKEIIQATAKTRKRR
jgi:hypothetical protein